MIFKYVVNTRNFLLDDSLNDFNLLINDITITNDKEFRKKYFLNEVGVRHIGLALLSATNSNDYAYATKAFDITNIDDNTPIETIHIENGTLSNIISGFIENFLYYLWFAKDNCVHYDYLYGYAESAKHKTLATVNYNHSIITNHKGEIADTSFSKDEILHVFKIWENAESLLSQRQSPQEINADNVRKGNFFSTPKLDYIDYPRIQRALHFLITARRSQFLLPKISTYIRVLECLFSTEKSDIVYKISQRIAMYVGNDYEERIWIKNFMRDAYNIRSTYIHASKISSKDKKGNKNKPALFSEENIKYTSEQLDNLLRIILTKVILYHHEIFEDDNKLNEFFNELIFAKY